MSESNTTNYHEIDPASDIENKFNHNDKLYQDSLKQLPDYDNKPYGSLLNTLAILCCFMMVIAVVFSILVLLILDGLDVV